MIRLQKWDPRVAQEEKEWQSDCIEDKKAQLELAGEYVWKWSRKEEND